MLRFLGGYWSFPGGAIESEDQSSELGEELACALREIKEELGVELPPAPAEYQNGGRWVTPEIHPIRFDTRYLVHEYAGGEPDPQVSGGELDAGQWVRYSEALQRWNLGEWLIPSPVLRVLRRVSENALVSPEAIPSALAEEAQAEVASTRLWFPFAGVGMSPLRTPTLPPATHTNMVVFGSGDALLVDPATPFDDERGVLLAVLDDIERRGGQVREIWLTHHHGDHVGSAQFLADKLGVVIAAHPETARLLDGKVAVTRLLRDGEWIELAGDPPRRVRALHTPGHAPGHLCFLEEHTRAIAAGDMVAGVGSILIDPSEGDMAAYLDSLRRLKAESPSILVPAHGPTIAAAQSKLDEYIAHRLWREALVVAELGAAQPLSSRELVTRVYRDVPEAIHPIAERSLLSHLLKLRAEGRASLDGDLWAARP